MANRMVPPDRMVTPDGRYIVVNGRRWRATDPSIPEPLRQELVNELMAARRAVAKGANDTERVVAARRRVHDAKVALGERGEPWWEPSTPKSLRARAFSAARALTLARASASSVDPREVAQIIASPEWVSAMPIARDVVDQSATPNGVDVDD